VLSTFFDGSGGFRDFRGCEDECCTARIAFQVNDANGRLFRFPGVSLDEGEGLLARSEVGRKRFAAGKFFT
jgi:hypothetical protein